MQNYTAEHIDTEKFEAGLESHKRYQEELQRTAIEKANARYEGYCQCLEDVRSMLHCSNYEKRENGFDRTAIDTLDNLRYMIGIIYCDGKPVPMSNKVMDYIKSTSESINQITRQSYANGADNALYKLCKELDIPSQDTRDMDTSVDEKAAHLASRIRDHFLKEEAKNRIHDYASGANEVLSTIYGAFGIKPSQDDLCREGGDPAEKAALLVERARRSFGEGKDAMDQH